MRTIVRTGRSKQSSQKSNIHLSIVEGRNLKIRGTRFAFSARRILLELRRDKKLNANVIAENCPSAEPSGS